MYIIICTHAVYNNLGDVYGPPHNISQYIKQKGIPYTFICHDLFGKNDANIYLYKDKKVIKNIAKKNKKLPRFIDEFVKTYYFLSNKVNRERIFIGVDPINAFYGIIFRFLGKVDKVVFYSADYAKERFENRLLSWLYRQLNFFCARHADYIWSVSRRIRDIWRSRGIKNNKNFFVPNAPILPKDFKIKSNKPLGKLVIVSHLTKGVHFINLFHAIKKLTGVYPKLRLSIIGSGDKEESLKKYIRKLRLTKNVMFLGAREHSEALNILNNSSIGFALYTDKASWSYYRDSLKLREYLALGLPVITTCLGGLAYQIKKREAGFVIEPSVDNIVDSLKVLLKDKSTFNKFQQNARKLADDYNIKDILDSIFEKMHLQ